MVRSATTSTFKAHRRGEEYRNLWMEDQWLSPADLRPYVRWAAWH